MTENLGTPRTAKNESPATPPSPVPPTLRVLMWRARAAGAKHSGGTASALFDRFLVQWMAAWLLVLLWGEVGVFWHMRCVWPEPPSASSPPGLVVMADMQLSDWLSYRFAPKGSVLLALIERVNDAFLRRAFRFAVRPLNAAAHIYAGDIFDHLREADNATRHQYGLRFERIFPSMKLGVPTRAETPSIFVEGNHDVGVGGAYSPAAQDWFAHNFGVNITAGSPSRIFRTAVADIVTINAPALVSLPATHPQVVSSLMAATEGKSCRPDVACLLLSHIPLWREHRSGCRGGSGGDGAGWRKGGEGSDEIRHGAGYSYVNMLPEKVSKKLLWEGAPESRARWDAVLSGDDHSWCVHTHRRPGPRDHEAGNQAGVDDSDEVVEFTVGTMSWLQGATTSWVLLLQFSRQERDVVRQSVASGEMGDVRFGHKRHGTRGEGVARACALPKERQVLAGYIGLGFVTAVTCVWQMVWMNTFMRRGAGVSGMVMLCGQRLVVLLLWALSVWGLLLWLV